MNEQHETWMPWSDRLNQHDPEVTSWRMGHLSEIECECDILNIDRWKGATDWRPVRILKPAKIEALERDAARYRCIKSSHNFSVAHQKRGWIGTEGLDAAIDAAMEGGE